LPADPVSKENPPRQSLVQRGALPGIHLCQIPARGEHQGGERIARRAPRGPLWARFLSPIPDAIIEEWQHAVDDKKLITIEQSFQPGDEVEIVEGPMMGIRTIITRVFPAQERIRILLDLLGELREVEVSLDSVCKKENIRLASSEVSLRAAASARLTEQ